MSLKSWKQEFYPITALQAAKTLDTVGLVEHAIQKWIGLRKKNLEKHELMRSDGRDIIEIEFTRQMEIDDKSCSLCRRFLGKHENCYGCPLYESRNEVRCFNFTQQEDRSPWGAWTFGGTPEPMIKALRKALKWAKEHQG